MDILSEVLEVLDLKCTSVRPIALSDVHTGQDAPMQAYFVISGRCTLRFGDDDAEFDLRSLDGVLLADGDPHVIQPRTGGSSSPIRWRATCRSGCCCVPGISPTRANWAGRHGCWKAS